MLENFEFTALWMPILILLREGLEAFLLTTLILKVSEAKQGQSKYVFIGALNGVLFSIFLAFVLYKVSLDYEEVMEYIGFITVGLLFYVAFYSKKISIHLKEHINSINMLNPFAIVVGVSAIFMREGAEVVLMLWSMLQNNLPVTLIGVVVGVVLLAIISKFLKLILDKINIQYLFKYASFLFFGLGLYLLYETVEKFL